MTKMKLYYSPISPYARKVRVVAMETRLDRKIEMVNVAVSPVVPNADVVKHNPVGKVPALSVKGMDLFDSPVICETSTASTEAASSCRARAASGGWRSGYRRWPTASSMPRS
jgi:hypothetical protein